MKGKLVPPTPPIAKEEAQTLLGFLGVWRRCRPLRVDVTRTHSPSHPQNCVVRGPEQEGNGLSVFDANAASVWEDDHVPETGVVLGALETTNYVLKNS